MPIDLLGESLEVVLELEAESGLSNARLADDEREAGAGVDQGGVDRVDQCLPLGGSSDERRLGLVSGTPAMTAESAPKRRPARPCP